MESRIEFKVAGHLDLYCGTVRPNDLVVLALGLGMATSLATGDDSIREGVAACMGLGVALLGLLILNTTGFAAMRVPTKDVLRVGLHTSCVQLMVVGLWTRTGIRACVLPALAAEFLAMPMIALWLHNIKPSRFYFAQLVSLLTICGGVLGVALAIVAIGFIVCLTLWVAPWELLR